VKTTVATRKLEDINNVFAQMKKGAIDGRIVLDMR
jgi:propanol-preferring alcohol dehydrogenase